MSDRKEYILEDFAEILNHKRIPLSSMERETRHGIYPYYGASGIIDYVNDFIFDGEHVLISEDGENLKSRQTPIAFIANGKFWVNNHAHIIRGKKDYLNRLIVYYFQNLDLNPYLTGAVQPKLNKATLTSIPIYLPESELEQTAIAEVLSSLDDKIDLLHRQNKTLEQLAETLFRQWFVEEAEEGWEEVSLSEFIKVKHGYAFKGSSIVNEPTNFILVTPGNFRIGGGFKSDKFKYYSDADFPEDYIFKTDDLIVTMTDLSVDGDTLGYAALVPENIGNEIYLHNQRVGKIEFIKPIGKYFIYHLMKTADYQWYILSGASGTSIRHTSPTSICSYKFLKPPDTRIVEFEDFSSDLEKKIKKNTIQIKTLTQLRDTLLPKLMSGEVRVK
jgi:type I restriction enzyme S subunit